MTKVSSNRGHCLMTTTQLLGLAICIKNNPTYQDRLISELFATVGKYQHFENYTKFIEI